MPAPRPAKRRTTETTSLKLLLTAATLSLTIGGWGAISRDAHDADLETTTTIDVAAADFNLGLTPVRAQVAAAPPTASASAPRIVVAPPAAVIAPASRPVSTQKASSTLAAAAAARPAARTRASR